MIPRYLSKFDDAVHVSEHELGDVDCELTVDFRPLVPCISRGEAELLLAFVEVGTYQYVFFYPGLIIFILFLVFINLYKIAFYRLVAKTS